MLLHTKIHATYSCLHKSSLQCLKIGEIVLVTWILGHVFKTTVIVYLSMVPKSDLQLHSHCTLVLESLKMTTCLLDPSLLSCTQPSEFHCSYYKVEHPKYSLWNLVKLYPVEVFLCVFFNLRRILFYFLPFFFFKFLTFYFLVFPSLPSPLPSGNH